MRRPTRREALIGGISVAITIALSVFIILHREYLYEIRRWGYVGCFVISVLTNGTFILPGFGIVFTFTLGGVLNPAVVGAVAGIGEAVGAIGAYLTGYAGRGLIRDSNSGLYLRLSNLVDRHGSKAIFFVSAVLSPLFYPFAVLLGTLRFGWVRFFLATWAGRTVKNMIIAYLGYFGLRSVLQWLGMNI
ncbi:MAG: VTT domain-containing protein [Dehalococcoidia bacterium]|nr:VTT domain-containing protein [Dehalococcoidia bacterium]